MRAKAFLLFSSRLRREKKERKKFLTEPPACVKIKFLRSEQGRAPCKLNNVKEHEAPE